MEITNENLQLLGLLAALHEPCSERITCNSTYPLDDTTGDALALARVVRSTSTPAWFPSRSRPDRGRRRRLGPQRKATGALPRRAGRRAAPDQRENPGRCPHPFPPLLPPPTLPARQQSGLSSSACVLSSSWAFTFE